MTDQHKKHFFEHWITAYGNRLDEVARHKTSTNTKLTESSLQEVPLSASPALEMQNLQPRPHTMSTETPVKTPINRSHQ